METNTYEERVSSLSRRNFLSKAGAFAAGTVVASAALPNVAHAEGSGSNEEEPVEIKTQEERIFDGVTLAIGRIVHNPDLCAGCRQCEIACSVNKYGIVNSELSNIRIKTDILGGYISEAHVCKQCAGAECIAACPSDAMYVDPETGARIIDQEVCVGCQVCMNACPVEPSRIHYVPSKNVYGKCDLCGGDPICIACCPADALQASWIEQEDDGSIIVTESGVAVELIMSGAVLVVDPTAAWVDKIDVAVTGDSVIVSGEVSSTYTQQFTTKIKASFFDAEGETLFFSERLEVDVDPNTTEPFEDVFETSEPHLVSSISLEVMCGKIAG